jgi:hypothetical protein
MSNDAVAELIAEAVRGLVRFVDERPDGATADGDVRALEDVVYILNQVDPEDEPRLRALLGPEFVAILGWT